MPQYENCNRLGPKSKENNALWQQVSTILKELLCTYLVVFNMILDLIVSMLQGIPSKKNISINKKIKLLKDEDWYKAIINKHGNLFVFNTAFRDFIDQNDIENILKDQEQSQVLQKQLMKLLINENL